ncbi:MAG: hypothetical protein JEZ09_09115 [Salinivirgaceae bacterium]|nr:hypothetical protein [Salinivirgaceae bacterium]
MKKIIVFFSLALVLVFASENLVAQLSDRVNSPTTFKTGTRPTYGNFGFSIGTSFRDIQTLIDDDVTYEMLPVTTVKYYLSDDFVLLAGIKGDKTKVSYKGDVDPLVDGSGLGITSYEFKEMESNFMIVPGVEKHFIHSNILDAYVGVSVPLGFRRKIDIRNQDIDGGGFNYFESKANKLIYGINGYFGLQAFIADLPIAIGVEFGFTSLGVMGDKAHVTVQDDINGSVEYYSTDLDKNNIDFSKLKASKFDLESDIRVTLSYFFRK